MKIALIAALALAVLTTPILAEGEREEVEKMLFEGYYLEHGSREFGKAKAVYELLAWEYEDDFPDLAARAYIGLFRLAIRRGDEKAEKFMAGVEAAIKFAAKTSNAEVVAALNKEFDAAKVMLSAVPGEDTIASRIGRFIETLDQGPDSNNGKHAVADLVLFGDRAVPAVAAKLRSDHPRGVAAAARVLVRIGTDTATAALTAGISDPKGIFPAQIVSELAKGDPQHASAVSAALGDRRPAVRSAAATSLLALFRKTGGRSSELWEALLRGVSAGPARERLLLLSLSPGYWTPEATIRLARVVKDDKDPQVAARLNDIVAIGLKYRSGLSEEDLATLPSLMGLASPPARTRVLATAIDAGGDVALSVVALALDDEDASVRQNARHAIHFQRVPWSDRFVVPLCASFTRSLMTEPTNKWSNSARDLQTLLPKLERNDENGMRLVALLKTALDEGAEDRRGIAAGYLYPVLADFSEKVKLAAYGVLTRDKDRAVWFKRLGPTAGKPVVDLAGKALASPDADLRSAAVVVLGRLGDDRVLITNLKPLVNDQEPKIRRAAVHALMPRVSVEFRRDLALKAIADTDLTIRLTGVKALIVTPITEWYEPLLEAVAKDPNGLAVAAVQAVAAQGDHVATRRFLAKVLLAAENASAQVRANAFFGARDALTDQMILDALRSDSQLMVRSACIIAVDRHLLAAWPVMLDIQSKFTFVATYLKRLRDYHVGMKEYLDVRDTEGEDLYAKADDLARSKEPQHRVAACYAYAALKGPRAMSKLLDLVRDEEGSVREAALAGLKKVSVE
jgi:HEAT repeat protein